MNSDQKEPSGLFDESAVNAPSESVREEHRYLRRGDHHLYCAEYTPASGARFGLILCPPFAEEKIRTHRVYVSMARTLARLGAAAVLFDYFGDGDSEGSFDEASFDDRLQDIQSVYHDFSRRHELEHTGLIGLRWGGTLAALMSDSLRPSALVLWEPIVDTSKYFFDHLRSHLASQMLIKGKIVQKREQLVKALESGDTISVEGYSISGPFFVTARQRGLSDLEPQHDCPALIVQLAGSPARIRPDLQELSGAYRNIRLEALRREFEWEKTERWCPVPVRLFNLTLDFLKSNELL